MPAINVKFTETEFDLLQTLKGANQNWKEFILGYKHGNWLSPDEVSTLAEMHTQKALKLYHRIQDSKKTRNMDLKTLWTEAELELHKIALGEIALVIQYTKRHPNSLNKFRKLSNLYSEAADSISQPPSAEPNALTFTAEEEYKLALGMAAFNAYTELSPYFKKK